MDKILRTSQQLINRVANNLSHMLRAAGITVTNMASLSSHHIYSNNYQAHCKLRSEYGGEARHPEKYLLKPYINVRQKNRYRRIKPRFMQAMEGCFVWTRRSIWFGLCHTGGPKVNEASDEPKTYGQDCMSLYFWQPQIFWMARTFS